MKRDWKIIKDILCAIEDNKVKKTLGTASGERTEKRAASL